jgi:hypothetical protein
MGKIRKTRKLEKRENQVRTFFQAKIRETSFRDFSKFYPLQK